MSNVVAKFNLPDGRRGRVVKLFRLYYVIQVQSGKKAYRTLRDEGEFTVLEEALRAAQAIESHGL